MGQRIHECECGAEHSGDACSVIASDLKPAAALRPIQREGANEHVATRDTRPAKVVAETQPGERTST